MQSGWESELSGFLSELSLLQDELLELLGQKRQALAAADADSLAAIQPRENDLVARLQQCQERRSVMLDQAAGQGLPADSLRRLSGSLPTEQQDLLREQFTQSAMKSRLIQHHSLTNWVLIQRTLLHLSQVLEIIATGGRLQPTYGKGTSAGHSGSLVDHAA